MIRDKYIKDENGKETTTEKVYLLFVDGHLRLCDGCDKMKKCASICILGGDITIMCKDCLQDIINEF